MNYFKKIFKCLLVIIQQNNTIEDVVEGTNVSPFLSERK